MQRFFRPAWICLLVLAFPLLSLAVEIIPVSEIRPGMKGYGLTVLQGSEVVRFEVEVIDVIKNARPKQDAILVRCSGQGLERTRIIAGMSGSPIFLNDKLAGALAFAWEFSLDPIAGVTPIESMLEELQRPVPPLNPSFSGGAGRGLVPIATPLTVSGLDAGPLAALEKELWPYGWLPVMGGTAEAGAAPEKLVLGGAIGAQLVSGDINMTTVGTVTYLSGSTVLAFGHSFFNAGPMSLPLTTARIHTVLSSEAISFKIASPGPVVGRLTQDRQAGITGRLGELAPTVPYSIHIQGPGKDVSRDYQVAVIQHPLLTPILLQVVLQQVLESGAALAEPHTINLKVTADFAGYAPITYEDTLYSLKEPSPGQMLAPVRRLLLNPFAKTELRSMRFDLEVRDRMEMATLESLRAYPLEVEPGDTVTVYVRLKPFQAAEEEAVLRIQVPEQAEEKFSIRVAGGSQMAPDVAPPQSVDDLIAALHKLYPARSLVAGYSLPGRGVDLMGQRLRRLPASVVSVLTPASATSARAIPESRTLVQEVPYVVVGSDEIQVKVRTPLRR
jgi:hypothetical protein